MNIDEMNLADAGRAGLLPQSAHPTHLLVGFEFRVPKVCCSTNLTEHGQVQPSKEQTSLELLARTKKEGVAFHYPAVRTPSDLRALLEQIMLEEGSIEADCAAMTQIVLFMRPNQENRPSYFVLAFGRLVWEQTTYYQRQREFAGLDVNSLCTFSLHKQLLGQVACTIDAVALTFGEKVAVVTKTSRCYSSHWLCVDRKHHKLLGFTGLNDDNQPVRMSLEKWFDFLVRQVDAEMQALKTKRASNVLAESLLAVHDCLVAMDAYKFEEAMVLVVGARVPAREFLAMNTSNSYACVDVT